MCQSRKYSIWNGGKVRSSRVYHRNFIIAVLSSQSYHRGFIIAVISSQPLGITIKKIKNFICIDCMIVNLQCQRQTFGVPHIVKYCSIGPCIPLESFRHNRLIAITELTIIIAINHFVSFVNFHNRFDKALRKKSL